MSTDKLRGIADELMREAALAARPGQMDRLEALAAELRAVAERPYGVSPELAKRVHAAWQLANEEVPQGTPLAQYWQITAERDEQVAALYQKVAEAWHEGGGFPYILLVDAQRRRRDAVREARKQHRVESGQVPVQ